MNHRFDFAAETLTPEDIQRLKELAEMLWSLRRQVAAEWSDELVRALPEYFPAGNVTLAQLTEINEAFLVIVVQQLRSGDLERLYETFYSMNAQLIDASLRSEADVRISLESLYVSARISFQVIETHLGSTFPRHITAYAKLTAQLMMLVGRAYSDRREESLKRTFEQMQTLSRLFQGVLESAPDAMVIVNRAGEIVLVNSQTEHLFGYGRDEMLGQPVEMLIPERFRGIHPQHRMQYAEAAALRPMGLGIELYGRRHSGEEFPVEVSLSPLETGEGLLVTSVIRDVTDRKQAEEEIRRLNTDLERRVQQRTAALARSNAELEQFAYVASHDLQEPLRAVASYTQLLGRRYRERLDDDADKLINRVTGAVARMQDLIHDLLAFSRVDTVGGKLEPCNAEQVLGDVLEDLQTAILESGAAVTAAPLPMVAADPGQLRQLFQNLIGNAIKFRGAEPPRVHVSARESGGEWLFSVSDNGIGLDEQFAVRIFVIFQRLHSRRAYPGTGVGLAICKKIVERHGGRIWVESVLGKGATFFFSIPRETP